MTTRILIAEDERSIADNLVYALETDGCQVTWKNKAGDCLEFFTENKSEIDLLILDIGLPDFSGFELCQKIRAFSQVPIFFLTARSEEIDRVLGLEMGADDYIVKPFSPRELCSRVRAFFRRFDAKAEVTSENEVIGPFEIVLSEYRILFSGKPLTLRRYEFQILRMLMKKPGRVYSRAQIMENIWDNPDMSLERTIDSHVKSIRKSIKEFSSTDWIVTHRGIGYSFVKEPNIES